MAQTLTERLPGEGQPVASARGAALLVALVLALVVGANLAAGAFLPTSKLSHDGMLVHKKWSIANSFDAADSVVAIGDSSGCFGVSTAVLEERLGRPAYNLCTYGKFQVTGAGWMLDEMLEHSTAPPELVIVVLGTRTFAMRSGGATLSRIPVSTFGWRGRVPGVGLGPLASAEFFAARTFPLLYQHPSYAKAIRRWDFAPDLSRLVIEDRGFGRLPSANPRGVRAIAARTLGEIEGVPGPLVTGRERAAIEGLVADADERGYDLVFVDSPVWEGLVGEPTQAAALDTIHSVIDAACAGSTRARRLPGGPMPFPDGRMQNPFHLTAESAPDFTAALAEALRDLLESGRPGPR